MDKTYVKKNIDYIKFAVNCSTEEAFKYLDYRGNINTNPKFGLMNNFSIGNKFSL